jgi:hypothetical protein
MIQTPQSAFLPVTLTFLALGALTVSVARFTPKIVAAIDAPPSASGLSMRAEQPSSIEGTLDSSELAYSYVAMLVFRIVEERPGGPRHRIVHSVSLGNQRALRPFSLYQRGWRVERFVAWMQAPPGTKTQNLFLEAEAIDSSGRSYAAQFQGFPAQYRIPIRIE